MFKSLIKLIMKEKEKKFITIAEAVDEICHDFRSYPNQYDLFSKIYTFLVGGKAVPGEEKCPQIFYRSAICDFI